MQDVMREDARTLWRLLGDEGGWLYISGCVDRALLRWPVSDYDYAIGRLALRTRCLRRCGRRSATR